MRKLIIKRKDLFGALLTLFIAVCAYNPYGLIQVPGKFTRMAFFLVALLCIYLVSWSPNQNKYKNEKAFLINDVFLWVLLPDLILMLVSFASTLYSGSGTAVLTSTLRMFSGRILITLFFWGCVIALGERAVSYFFWGLTLSYSYTLIRYFISEGLFSGLAKATIGSYLLPIEVHNMTYIFGYLAVYFSLMDNVSTKNLRFLKAGLCFIFVYFGQKRLVLLSLFIGMLLWWLLHRSRPKARKMIIRANCIAAILIGLGYLYAIYSGLLARIVESLNINTSSRLNFYTYFASKSAFSPFYLGKGITYTDTIMASANGMRELNVRIVTTLHNDLLRIYIGVGMIPLMLYLIYTIYSRTKMIQRKFGEKNGFFYFAVTMVYYMNWFASNAGLEMWCYSGYVFIVLILMHRKANETVIKVPFVNRKRNKVSVINLKGRDRWSLSRNY